MNSIAKMLADHFPDYVSCKRDERRQYVEATLLFMLGAMDSTTLTRTLKPLHGNAKNYRMAVKASGELFRIKMWIMYCWSRDMMELSHPRAQKAIRHFRIRENDHRVLEFVLNSKKLTKIVKSHTKRYASTITTFDKFLYMISDAAKDLEGHASRYVAKQMRFITRANGMDVHDLAYELIAEGVQGVMAMYPRIESPLHAINIIKTTIHNAGVNVQQRYSTKSRGTLFKNKDGTFTSIKVSYDSLVSERKIYEGGTGSTDGGGYASMGFDETDDRDVVGDTIAASQLLAAYKGKRLRLLQLMCGELDVNFTRYLRKQKVIRVGKDNEDLFHDLSKEEGGYDAYIEHAARFVKLDPVKGRRFVRRLRRKLGTVNNGQAATS